MLEIPVEMEARALQGKQAEKSQVDSTEAQDDRFISSSLQGFLSSSTVHGWFRNPWAIEFVCVVLGIKPRTTGLHV